MCGILGYFSINNNFDPGKFARANNIVKYRGPDDFGYITVSENLEVMEWRDESMLNFRSKMRVIGALGSRRLSILDLSPNGHQPMHDGSLKYWIVFNGEIYNYLEIRNELIMKGYKFCSGTDTEVILKAYLEWDYECLDKFNGMWSFCILDIQKRKLFCARDRFGIKPFYYFFDGRIFIFGSKVKQLLELIPTAVKANRTVLFDYLALGSYGNESAETFFKDVYKLLPGQRLELGFGGMKTLEKRCTTWWDFGVNKCADTMRERDIFDRIKYLLEDSVRLRLRSDVPVGTCLSGGLDSSGIVCLVDDIVKSKGISGRHKVLTVGVDDPETDERRYAEKIIKKTKVKSYLRVPTGTDLVDDLEQFIWHHDEPLVSASMYGGWHAYKLAKESGVTVALDGQGADELMAGYYRGAHVDYLCGLLLSFKLALFLKELKANASLHRISSLGILYKMSNSLAKRLIRPVVSSRPRPFLHRNLKKWFNEDFVRGNMAKSHVLNRDYYNRDIKYDSGIKRQIYLLTKFTSLPGILRQVDRNSMAFSVEARLPFLDFRLAELLFTLPIHFIIRNGYTKYAYREAMRGIIPEEIRLRVNKIGFAMPEQRLLRDAIKVDERLIDRIPLHSDVYRGVHIREDMRDAINSKKPYDRIVWRILNATVWQSRFAVQ